MELGLVIETCDRTLLPGHATPSQTRDTVLPRQRPKGDLYCRGRMLARAAHNVAVDEQLREGRRRGYLS